MKFYVTYDCGFDENDGDECKKMALFTIRLKVATG